MRLDGRALSWSELHVERQVWYERQTRRERPMFCAFEGCRWAPVAGWDRCLKHRERRRKHARLEAYRR